MVIRRLALALVALPTLAQGAESFVPLSGFERLRGALAVATDSRNGSVAVGTSASVWLAKPGAPARRVLRKGEVRDLLFAPDGALWAATEQGLFELRAESEQPHALGPGASGRPTRLLLCAGFLLVGTEGGLVGGVLGGPFATLDGAAPGGAIQALAAIDAAHVFVAADGDLFRASLSTSPELRLTAVERQVLPAGDGAVVDLAVLGAGTLLALRERSFAVLDAGARTFERHAIQAPPGAVPARVLAGSRGVWLGTDAGLLLAASLGAAFERSPAPVGGLAIADLAEDASGLVVASQRGVFRSRMEVTSRDEPSAAAPARSSPEREPSVLAVQRAALRYGGLDPSRMAELRERAHRRGRWPELELFAGWVDTQSRERDRDEAFTSGLDRTFHDRNHSDDRRLDAGISLNWDLGDAVYHTEEIDVAHETREWIELRDEVLDEIAQLYFERRRVLLDRANERDALTAERLRIRAAELEAGLDAWTGGWWSAQRELLASPPRPAKDSTP